MTPSTGLGFSVAGVGDGRTDSAGKFQFDEGRKIDFFVGGTANRITIGSATPDSTVAGNVGFSFQDLTEVNDTNGDVYLGNLLRLLVLLDANDDTTDGFRSMRPRTPRSAPLSPARARSTSPRRAPTFGNDAAVTAHRDRAATARWSPPTKRCCAIGSCSVSRDRDHRADRR